MRREEFDEREREEERGLEKEEGKIERMKETNNQKIQGKIWR